MENVFKDKINPSNYFSVKTTNDILQSSRGKGVVSLPPPPQCFLLMCPFFRRALKRPILKEVTKGVHENYYSLHK